ncbi:MAG: hypothetical protein LC798_21390 [Chloroflexi bacterium]|nr:hypothetical protein [Chloroflexota bacterium]
MTALDELRAGRTGEHFAALLQHTIRAVAIARGFPPPEGHDSWGGNALITAVNDFLVSPQTPRRLTDLRTHCRTEEALKRRLERTVRNFLADYGRRTPVGRLVLRFNDILRKEPAFERRGSFWSLTGTNAEPAPVDLDALAAALAAVDVVVPAAWMTGDRQSPDLDADSVVRLASAALQKAGGPLRTSVIAQAAAHRLGIGGTPLSVDATAFDPSPPATISGDATGDEALIRIRANEVFALLNDHERIALGCPEVPVAKLGPVLGVSGSKGALIRKRAVTILQTELRSEDAGQAVADAVFELARTWTEWWMI